MIQQWGQSNNQQNKIKRVVYPQFPVFARESCSLVDCTALGCLVMREALPAAWKELYKKPRNTFPRKPLPLSQAPMNVVAGGPDHGALPATF